ncbi:hypothetical protein CFC21_077880 [Triticum aestivum]|uniref:F-box domain-containing protein n=2 Tax=Triticum aestivum TaxID=4565 RepID=A0A3B6MSM3_WHEAT|nr:hypothetical protein CFC21_077880 [Triticum aestivum]
MPATLRPSSHQWADLLPELLGRVIDRLPRPDDRARFRAVCRPWHLAVRQHNRPQLPWIIYLDGTFVTFPDHGIHHGLSLPDDTTFIGVCHSWLAFYRIVNGRRIHLLHNPFTKSTVPLRGLDSVIDDTSNLFEIRKVIMPSTEDDIVAVTTSNCNYPIILCRPGKPGAWWPQRGEMPYASIFDVVFYRGKLSGITKGNDLVVMDIGEDNGGILVVKNVKYIIKHPPGDDDEEEKYEDDGQVLSNAEEEEVVYSEASSIDEDDEELDDASIVNDDSGDDKVTMNKPANKDNNFNIDDHKEVSSNEDEEEVDDGDYDDGSSILGDSFFQGMRPNTLDYRVPDGTEQLYCSHEEDRAGIVTGRHLFESNGKLFMLRRQQYVPVFSRRYNLKIEVLEADVKTGVWIPRMDGVPGAFFVSKHYSKHVPTYQEAGKKFIHHFVDEHNVGVNSRSQRFTLWDGKPTWFFPQEPVV